MSWHTDRVIWVTVDEKSGTAMVTGPAGGLWERLTLEVHPRAKWSRDWYGWRLDNLGQVADLCTLAEMNGMIWKERPYSPDLLPRLQSARRKKAQQGRRRGRVA